MHKDLNVLQIIDSLAVGGAEVMAVNIANGLLGKVNSSHVCVTRAEGLLKNKIEAQVGYFFLNKHKTVDVKAVLRLKTYIKKYQIQLIHAHSSSFFIAVLVKLLYPKVRIIWHDHYGKSEQIAKRPKKAIQGCSYFFSSIISVNKTLLQWAKQHLKTKNSYYLANFSTLSNSLKVTTLKGNTEKRIVCLAAFRPQKDHLNLLKAFQLLHQKHAEWTLHLVGNHQGDAYYQEVYSFIHQHKLTNKVFIYPACLDVAYVLQQASIGVLASKSEGLPLALIEYGLAKLPVIVTNVGDCKTVVNKYGQIVEKENPIAFANALEVYILDQELKNTQAKLYHQRVLKEYSSKAYFNKLLEIYHL